MLFGDPADVAGAKDPDVFAGAGGPDAAGAVVDGLPADPDVVDEVGDFLVEVDVLAAAEDDQVVGQAEQ